jgi:16S rRNA processing protein RimM
VSKQDRLAVGKVQRTHGTGGYVRVQSYSGETAHLTSLPAVYLEPDLVERAVEDVQVVSGGVLLKLQGVDRMEDAEKLRGAVIWVAREFAAPLSAGEFYAADLCGCEVRRAGSLVGTVLSLIEGGATDLLEVKGTGGETFLVPFVDEFVGEVSVERRVLELREGFELP